MAASAMTPIAWLVWNSQYRFKPGAGAGDADLESTWNRVAGAVAAAEADRSRWEAAFYSLLSSMQFLPGGRILAGAGTGQRLTLFNCFVAGSLTDSLDGILNALKESARTMQYGGGIGCDFSVLRPAGSPALDGSAMASGPVSFMQAWDSMCQTLVSTRSRRGAMMATLRCDHPDIDRFIAVKRTPGVLSHFNLSVLISDAFMQAVRDDAEWPLVFPAPVPGEQHGMPGHVCRVLRARDLWRQIAAAAHESGEPGILFIDRINRENNLYYCETISATNPCGEVPLPAYGACNLGSINLPLMVAGAFTPGASFDEAKLRDTVSVAVRFLDDVIDVSRFPLPQQAEEVRATRRVGLGVTGLADMLAMLGLHYDSRSGREAAVRILTLMRDRAYETSAQLAEEKGAFPRFSPDKLLQAPFIQRLSTALRHELSSRGLRNSHLLAIAPTGTISLLADNVSSGIEPIFALEANRMVRGDDLELHQMAVRDFAYARWLESEGGARHRPDCLVTAEELPAQAHLAMQASLQPCVDSAISKTVNLPPATTVSEVRQIFADAFALGLKGCTVFRRGSVRGQVLQARNETHCCPVENAGA